MPLRQQRDEQLARIAAWLRGFSGWGTGLAVGLLIAVFLLIPALPVIGPLVLTFVALAVGGVLLLIVRRK
ncbi:hypothetical protein [Methylorubrum sp. SB2]|uniref:hypothetical protein n=1 Tax=Methylorubrum subtropicum TaxID=3138812 RepID=UPI00313B0D85